MRRPGIGLSVALGLLWHGVGAHSATLAPSADPVAAFVSAADSVYRAGGDAALSPFIKDNSILAGAAVAKLLDDAFRSEDKAAARENVDFAKRVALAHESAGGTAVA